MLLYMLKYYKRHSSFSVTTQSHALFILTKAILVQRSIGAQNKWKVKYLSINIYQISLGHSGMHRSIKRYLYWKSLLLLNTCNLKWKFVCLRLPMEGWRSFLRGILDPPLKAVSYIGVRGTCAPLLVHIFIFMQFLIKIMPNNRLAPPGSATVKQYPITNFI